MFLLLHPANTDTHFTMHKRVPIVVRMINIVVISEHLNQHYTASKYVQISF